MHRMLFFTGSPLDKSIRIPAHALLMLARPRHPLLALQHNGCRRCAGALAHVASAVARPRNTPMLTTSVAVVRKMLDAVAGSAPILRRPSGINAPHSPLTMQLVIIAIHTTNP